MLHVLLLLGTVGGLQRTSARGIPANASSRGWMFGEVWMNGLRAECPAALVRPGALRRTFGAYLIITIFVTESSLKFFAEFFRSE